MRANGKVLLVDDEEAVRVSWNRYLSERDFEVTTAEDGRVAMDWLTREPVDVVVADLKMPTVSGIELLEWMRGATPDTPFILLTGYGNDDVKQRVRDLGGFEYLDKPVSPEVLAAVITAAMLRQKQEQEAAVSAVEAPAEAVAVEAPPVEAVRLAESAPRGGAVKSTAEVLGGLVVAPILGLAFVMFLPVIGFAAFFKVAAEAVAKRFKPANT